MRKVYYIYNPKTRTYDRIYPTVRQRALSYLRQLFVGMGLGAGSFILLLWIFGSPSEKDLRTENSRLLSQYAILSSRLDEAEGVMQRLQQRDDNIYRVMMQADPLPDEQRSATANNARYNELMDMATAVWLSIHYRKWMVWRRRFMPSPNLSTKWWGSVNSMTRCWPAFPPSSRFQTRI